MDWVEKEREKREIIIAEARRALRKATGATPTEEESEQERRHKELQKFTAFVHRSLGLRVTLELYPKVSWVDRPVALLHLGDQVFYLRPVDDNVQLLSRLSDEPILQLPRDDPQFSNRVVVAMADYQSAKVE